MLKDPFAGRIREVTTAPGDSGGPSFIDGLIAGVTSFGSTRGTAGTDVDVSIDVEEASATLTGMLDEATAGIVAVYAPFHTALSMELAERCDEAFIDRDERKGEKPSDHAPVAARFDGP